MNGSITGFKALQGSGGSDGAVILNERNVSADGNYGRGLLDQVISFTLQ
jgi:hypothetical protein